MDPFDWESGIADLARRLLGGFGFQSGNDLTLMVSIRILKSETRNLLAPVRSTAVYLGRYCCKKGILQITAIQGDAHARV